MKKYNFGKPTSTPNGYVMLPFHFLSLVTAFIQRNELVSDTNSYELDVLKHYLTYVQSNSRSEQSEVEVCESIPPLRISFKNACRLLDVSRQTVLNLIKTDPLFPKPFKEGNEIQSRVWFSYQDLVNYHLQIKAISDKGHILSHNIEEAA